MTKPAYVFKYMCECTACIAFVRTPAFFCVCGHVMMASSIAPSLLSLPPQLVLFSHGLLPVTDLKRKKRKQELLSRAERVLGLAQRLDAFEDTHVSAGSVAHRAAADYAVDNLATRGQQDKEEQQRSEDERDGEDSEADLDFDDLVRLYGRPFFNHSFPCCLP